MLTGNANFTLRINDTELVNVEVVSQNQQVNEQITTLVNRFLPQTVKQRLNSLIVTDENNQQFFAFKATDPNITKLEVIFSDLGNAIHQNLGFNSGQQSLPSYKFTSLQDFFQKLAAQSGLVTVDPQYDIATNRLSFRTKLTGAAQSGSVPLDFTAGLGPLSYVNPATANLTVIPSFDGRLGIELDQLQTVLTASGDAPSNGVLSSKATLQIALDGAAPITVSVARDTNNTHVDDLVADINAAIGLTSLKHKIVAGRTGNKLTLTANTGSAVEVTASASDPAKTELKLTGVGSVAQWNHSVSLGASSELQLQSSLSTSSLTGPASLGLLPITIASGILAISATAKGSLNQLLPLSAVGDASGAELTLPVPTTSLSGSFTTKWMRR